MTRLFAVATLAAIVLGIAGLTVATEYAAAQEEPTPPTFDLSCDAGEVVDGQGSVKCTLSVSGLPQGLPDVTLHIVADYADVDGSGGPSAGDQLKCMTVTSPDGTISAELGPCADQSGDNLP